MLAVIDVQERVIPEMADPDRVVRNCDRLTEAATLCGVPATATEQLPERLSGTIEPIRSRVSGCVEKLAFGAAGVLPMLPGREQIVLCGFETHACVLQTALQLLTDGRTPIVVRDACGCRHEADHDAAIERMQHSGITIVTTEMLMLEWVSNAAHPAFVEVSRLIREG